MGVIRGLNVTKGMIYPLFEEKESRVLLLGFAEADC